MLASRPHALLFGPDHFFRLQGRLRLRRGELLQSAVLIPERVKFLGLGAKQFRFWYEVFAAHPTERSQPSRSPGRPGLQGARCPPRVAPIAAPAVAMIRPARAVSPGPAVESAKMSRRP